MGKVPWRRTWQPTPAFLPGESHGQRSLVGCNPWGHKESDTTEHTHTHTYTPQKVISLSSSVQALHVTAPSLTLPGPAPQPTEDLAVRAAEVPVPSPPAASAAAPAVLLSSFSDFLLFSWDTSLHSPDQGFWIIWFRLN